MLNIKHISEEIEGVQLLHLSQQPMKTGNDGNDDTARVYNEAFKVVKPKPPAIEVDVPVRNRDIIPRFWIEVCLCCRRCKRSF